jgi:hypothetical protein
MYFFDVPWNTYSDKHCNGLFDISHMVCHLSYPHLYKVLPSLNTSNINCNDNGLLIIIIIIIIIITDEYIKLIIIIN